jgi:hypothetical protein
MEWRHSGSSHNYLTPSPPPKKIIYECNNSLENLSPRFGGIKITSSSLIIIQRASLSVRSITYLCRYNWRTFWRINVAGNSSIYSCSCMTTPRLAGHLQHSRNWPSWASIVLITLPILRIWPRLTTTFSLDWRKLKGLHFSSDMEVIAAAENWLDGQYCEFFWLAWKR